MRRIATFFTRVRTALTGARMMPKPSTARALGPLTKTISRLDKTEEALKAQARAKIVAAGKKRDAARKLQMAAVDTETAAADDVIEAKRATATAVKLRELIGG